MELIDANTNVQDYVETWMCNCSDYGRQHVMAVDDVCTLPVIDPVHAAGAVYCKECKYCKQHHEKQTNETSYKCTKYSFYDFSDRQPNDFCSQGILKLPLQEEISAWLTERVFFTDSVTETEFIMQQIYFDNSKYEGKQEDQQEIANNCRTVADAYYYIQTHELNIDKIHQRKVPLNGFCSEGRKDDMK